MFQIFVFICLMSIAKDAMPDEDISADNLILEDEAGKQFIGEKPEMSEDQGRQRQTRPLPSTKTPPTAVPCGCPLQHPCANTKKNHTVVTDDGTVVNCLVPSEQELLDEVKAIGGYNRHYVAVTLKEAKDNFDDLLGTRNGTNMTPWWSAWWKRWWRRHSHRIVRPRVHDESESSEVMEKRSESISCRKMTTHKGIHLCPACQRLTTLSSDRFPRYINELSCDSSTSGYGNTIHCMHGIGKCWQGKMNVDLLIRTDKYTQVASNTYKQVWKPITQEIRTCCECVLIT